MYANVTHLFERAPAFWFLKTAESPVIFDIFFVNETGSAVKGKYCARQSRVKIARVRIARARITRLKIARSKIKE